jgi:hypothetical protein
MPAGAIFEYHLGKGEVESIAATFVEEFRRRIMTGGRP